MKLETKSLLRLSLLTAALALLWGFQAATGLSPAEKDLWRTVRSAQDHLYEWRFPSGGDNAADPWKTGLIGVEWSPTTTTLGELSAKRTACDPLWAVQIGRWFDEAGLKPGDRVAILASSSFPGLVLSSIAAAEARSLESLLVVSLGASTWGANSPDHPWPVIERELRQGGFVRAKAAFYTLGGDGEAGGSLSPEGRALLEAAARSSGVPLRVPDGLQEAIATKREALQAFGPKMLVSIGGSHANLGDDKTVLDLPPGLVVPAPGMRAGDGVLGHWLGSGRPALHLLAIEKLALKEKIPVDSPPRPWFASSSRAWAAGAGLALFFGVLCTHRRWAWREKDD